MTGVKLAIVGATGLVAKTLLDLLAEQEFPIANLYLLASKNSAGKEINFRDKAHVVVAVEDFDFSKADVAIFSAGKKVSETFAPIAAEKNCWVIDNSSQFRYQDEIPLVIPAINGELLKKTNSKIISNPNCSTIQMLLAVQALHKKLGIRAIQVATYQAVSGQGREALAELEEQSAAVSAKSPVPKKIFTKQMAFNCLPMIDELEANGFSREEMKMLWETRKILSAPEIIVNPTAVRVPVFNGHALAIHLETIDAFQLEEAEKLIAASPGVKLIQQANKDEFPTQAEQADSSDLVYVGRLRKSLGVENGLNLWVVADNLRVGAALNALQILEELVCQKII
jgi:aspartate-semialdehyde dehydrogenase